MGLGEKRQVWGLDKILEEPGKRYSQRPKPGNFNETDAAYWRPRPFKTELDALLSQKHAQGTRVAASTRTCELLGNVMVCTVLVAFKAKRYSYILNVRLSLVPLSKLR